ncbi:hypothetical protein CGLAMM_01590 [Acetobacteraceae bacterium EV16G]
MEVPVLELAQALLKCPSVTPADAGALTYLADVLARLGFEIWHLPFGPEGAQTPNLFARRGQAGPHLCFAGIRMSCRRGRAGATHPSRPRLKGMCFMVAARVT